MTILRFFSAVTISLFMFASAVIAQNTLVATVNIRGAKIVSQDQQVFTISFNLTNREGVQSGVRYGVQLLLQTPEGQFVVDEKVYDEVLTLPENSSTAKTISYTAPKQLSGNYILLITSKNENNFPFGVSYAGNVTLSGGEGLLVSPETCTALPAGAETVPQNINIRLYIDLGQAIEVVCSAHNKSSLPITTSAVLETRNGGAYGTVASGISTINDTFSFSAQEKKTITLVVPTATQPGVYRANIMLSSETDNSNAISISYIVRGNNAVIENVSLDKDGYKKGETANLIAVWDAQLEESVQSTTLSVVLTNGFGMKCASPFEKVTPRSQGGNAKIALLVTGFCYNPQVTVSLSDDKGNILDQEKFSVKSTASIVDGKKVVGGIALLIAIVVLVVVMRKKKKAADTGDSGISPIAMLLPFIIFLAGVMVPFSSVKADTYDYFASNGDRIRTDVNLDYYVYGPNSPMQVIAFIESNSTTVAYPVNLTAVTTSNPSAQIIPIPPDTSVIIAPPFGDTGYYFYSDFLTPDAFGTYTVDFVTGIDDPGSVPGPSEEISTIDAHITVIQGETTLICEATLGVPATTDRNINLRVNWSDSFLGSQSNFCGVTVLQGNSSGETQNNMSQQTLNPQITDYCVFNSDIPVPAGLEC